jgi:hypothetical protein
MINQLVINSTKVQRSLDWEEEFEDTKGAIGIRISKKNRQHNGQKKKYKRTNNNLQNITYKTKDRVTRTTLKTGDELRCSGRVSSSCSTSDTRRDVMTYIVGNPRLITRRISPLFIWRVLECDRMTEDVCQPKSIRSK